MLQVLLSCPLKPFIPPPYTQEGKDVHPSQSTPSRGFSWVCDGSFPAHSLCFSDVIKNLKGF
jgi:hypothetical protein